jgi:hypothetical protein
VQQRRYGKQKHCEKQKQHDLLQQKQSVQQKQRDLQLRKQSEQLRESVREPLYGMPLNGYDVEFLPFIYISYKKNFSIPFF